jgi:DNA-binding GntR family transcriptional regulator
MIEKEGRISSPSTDNFCITAHCTRRYAVPKSPPVKKSKRKETGMKQRGGISFDKPASSQVYEFARDSIVSMEVKPGQMISETALAEQFGVSRTPVREALIRLSNLGFVEVRPQRGTFVTKLCMDKILEARFIREALEVAVACHLAEHASKEMIESCEQIIKEQKIAAEKDDVLEFQALDDKFHQAMARFTGYGRTGDLIEAEKAHMDRVRNLSLQRSGQYKRVLAQHNAILKAIKSGDAEKAREAMALHLRDVYKVLKVIPQEYPEYFED